jgi:hypothetical protein
MEHTSIMDHYDYVSYIGFSDPDADRSVLKDTIGRYRTNIFYEFNKSRHEDYPPLYTMREDEWKGLPSAYRIYMTSDSEYEAAMKLVGSWAHWQRLLKCKPFMNGGEEVGIWTGLEQWREEKQIQDKARAYVQLKTAASEGNVTAQKMLFEGDKVSKRGRPSKAEIAKETVRQAQVAEQVKEDFKRIKLAVSNG